MKRNKMKVKYIKPYLWLIPSFLIFFIFTFYPFLKTIYQSFFLVNAQGEVTRFVGIENYLYILTDDKFLIAIKNTVIFTAFTVPISKVIGFLLALLANKRRKLSPIYETAFALPMAMSSSIIAMIFQLLYVYPLGLLNGVFHLNIRWLTDPKYALLAIGIVQIWLSSGHAFVFMLSAVRSVSNDVLESAQIDGVTGFQKIIKIYLPLTTPTLFYLIVTDLAYSMMMMGLVNVLTQGGPNNSTMTIMQYIYRQFAGTGNYTNANPSAVIAFFITLLCTLLTFIWEKKGVHYQ